MSTPIQPGDRIAVTATWVVTLHRSASAEQYVDAMRAVSVPVLPTGEQYPVSVSARPVHDLGQPDTAVPGQPTDRWPPPDLFFGPTLARETLRRIAEADRFHRHSIAGVAGDPIVGTADGEPIVLRDAAEVAEHMRVTALALGPLVNVAERLGRRFGDRPKEWSKALSGVLALTPPPAEEQADEALMDELTEAVRAGADKAWAEHHGTSSDGDKTGDGAW